MADYDLLDVERDGRHLSVTLANPDAPNPINPALMAELHDALDTVDEDTSIVTITGEGAFAVGADIGEMHDWIQNDEWDALLEFFGDGQELMHRIDRLDAVTVAGIDGYALGGGLELALACDIRFAGPDATVGFPEIDLGLIPGWGGTQRLPRVVGESTAKDMIATGRHVGPEEALEMGLVDRYEEDVEEALTEYAADIAEKPPETLRLTFEAIEAEGNFARETLNDALSAMTEDAQERIEAFVDE